MMSTIPDRLPAVTGQNGGRPLLLAGALAGPLYVDVGAAQVLVRDGFDITRHSLSLLANGDGGWVHVTMMVTTGALTAAGAVGLAQSLPANRTPRWVPALVGLFGCGVAASGLMIADPAFGFPPGAPDGMPAQVSWHGLGHLAAGSVGFLGLILACLLMWRWFRAGGHSNWSVFSLVTGTLYFVAFAGIATGGGSVVTNLGFTAAVALGWTWLTLLFGRTVRAGGLR